MLSPVRAAVLSAFLMWGAACGGGDTNRQAPLDVGSGDVQGDGSHDTGDAGPDSGAGCDIPCGSACCPEGQECDVTSQLCVCSQRGCDELGRECGPILIGCTTVVSCGSCQPPEICSASGRCLACTPDPDDELCGGIGRDCGSTLVLDNCGTSRTIDCGPCPSGHICQPDGTCVQ